MKHFIKNSLSLLGCLTIASCSFLSPIKTGPDTGYVINAAPDQVVLSRRSHHTLLILQPETNPVYNTTRIAFTMHPYQVAYYSKSHWIEAPADMLQPLLVSTLQKTNHYQSIIAPPFVGKYDYALRTRIEMLQVDYARQLPVLQLRVQGYLIRANNGSVMASRDFKVEVPLGQKSPYGAAIAANRAASILLSRISQWCVSTT